MQRCSSFPIFIETIRFVPKHSSVNTTDLQRKTYSNTYQVSQGVLGIWLNDINGFKLVNNIV